MNKMSQNDFTSSCFIISFLLRKIATTHRLSFYRNWFYIIDNNNNSSNINS